MSIDIEALRAWIGRKQQASDLVSPGPAEGLSRLLDWDVDLRPGAPLPPLWHWLYALPRSSPAEIGSDGHPRPGGFLPASPLPRRMWAGSEVVFHKPLRIDDQIERVSKVREVTLKEGRSGALIFVEVEHRLSASGGIAAVETQRLVYREAYVGGPPTLLPPPGVVDSAQCVDQVSLFRFSALTYNSHRIHYDRPYAREVEGYPDLVVHGPYQAMMLMRRLLDERPDGVLSAFSFSARSPLFVDRQFRIETERRDAETVARIRDEHGTPSFEAQGVFA